MLSSWAQVGTRKQKMRRKMLEYMDGLAAEKHTGAAAALCRHGGYIPPVGVAPPGGDESATLSAASVTAVEAKKPRLTWLKLG